MKQNKWYSAYAKYFDEGVDAKVLEIYGNCLKVKNFTFVVKKVQFGCKR